jgi:hypothetical protein
VRIALYRDLTALPTGWIRHADEPTKETAIPGEYIEVSRTVEFEGVLSPSVARSIGEWLIRQAELIETAVPAKEAE